MPAVHGGYAPYRKALLHHCSGLSLETIRLCNRAARSSPHNSGCRFGVLPGISETEQLQFGLRDVPFGVSDLGGNVGKFIIEILQLSFELPALNIGVIAAQMSIGVAIDFFLDITNTSVKIVCIPAVATVQCVLVVVPRFVLDVDSVQKNTLLLDLFPKLVQ